MFEGQFLILCYHPDKYHEAELNLEQGKEGPCLMRELIRLISVRITSKILQPVSKISIETAN